MHMILSVAEDNTSENTTGCYTFTQSRLYSHNFKTLNYILMIVIIVLLMLPGLLQVVFAILLTRYVRSSNRKQSALTNYTRQNSTVERARMTNVLRATAVSSLVFIQPQCVLEFLFFRNLAICAQESHLNDLVHCAQTNRLSSSIYRNLKEVWTLCDILNSIMLSVIYCFMSKQFRQTFFGIMSCKKLKWLLGI